MALVITWIGAHASNFEVGRGPYKPLAIVMHLMAGTLTGTDDWFNDPRAKVSAHYGVGKAGQIHQYVKEEDRAWHAGRVDPDPPTLPILAANPGVNPNDITIGIEHEGAVDDAWTEEMIDASARLVADVASRWGIPIDDVHVVRHHDIFNPKPCPGPKCPLELIISQAQSAPNPSYNPLDEPIT